MIQSIMPMLPNPSLKRTSNGAVRSQRTMQLPAALPDRSGQEDHS